MKVINVGKSKLILESLNGSSGQKCSSLHNKNVIFRGSINSSEYGSTMCCIAMLNDLDELFWVQQMANIQKNFTDEGGYFVIWSYWKNPDQTNFMGSISKDQDELEAYANSILDSSGLNEFISTRPQKPQVKSGISIRNGVLHTANSVKVVKLGL